MITVSAPNSQNNNKAELCHTTPAVFRHFRTAYLSTPHDQSNISLNISMLQILDSKAQLRKYYPKKIVSVINLARDVPFYSRSSTKTLRSLKSSFPCNIKGTIRSLKNLELVGSKFSPVRSALEYRKILRASKDLETLKIKTLIKEKSLYDIKYLTALRTLNLKISCGQLPVLTDTITGLNLLESVSLLFICEDPLDEDKINDPVPFLGFCDKALAKKRIKVFNLDFEPTAQYYTTETFEELFVYLEKSKIEQWCIQATLLEDRVQQIAEKCDIFRQAEHIAMHTWEIASSQIKPQTTCKKLLNIFLLNCRMENYKFDLESVLKQCTNLQHLSLIWGRCGILPRFDRSDSFKSLKTIYFNSIFREKNTDMQHLLYILENAPSLKSFKLKTSNPMFENLKPEEEVNLLLSCAARLGQIKTLKNVDLSIAGLEFSKRSLKFSQNLFGGLAYLKEFSLELSRSSETGIEFSKLTELTHFRLHLPFPRTLHLEKLSNDISHLIALRVFEFESGHMEIPWEAVQHLMESLENLTELEKVVLQISISFGVIAGIESQVKVVKEAVRNLAHCCRKLKSVQVLCFGLGEIEYIETWPIL